MDQKTPAKTSLLTILSALVAGAVVLNILFIALAANEVRTIELLKKELTNLEQNAQIIASSQQIYNKYKDDIEVISAVFPTEESIPQFISQLEGEIRQTADEYTFKFSSITPISENTVLFLPLSITMKTDLTRLTLLLEKLENLAYITHVTSINTKAPEGLNGISEVNLQLKVYVQNPFTN